MAGIFAFMAILALFGIAVLVFWGIIFFVSRSIGLRLGEKFAEKRENEANTDYMVVTES